MPSLGSDRSLNAQLYQETGKVEFVTRYTVFDDKTGKITYYNTYQEAADYMNSIGGSAMSNTQYQSVVQQSTSAVNAVYYDNQQVNLQTGQVEDQVLLEQNQANATGVNPARVPPGAEQPLPSEVASGFYDNTPVDANTLGITPVNQELGVALVQEPPGAEADPFAQPPVDEEGLVRLNDGANLGVPDEFGFVQDPATGLFVLPEDQEPGLPDGYLVELTPEGDRVLNPEQVTVAQEQAEAEYNTRQRARQQQAIASQRRQTNNGDWRVRLRLAPQSKYLYNAPQPGILQPLTVTDGIVFPYTPAIETSYKADYDAYALTHSNYRGYFYKSSYAGDVSLRCMFTAQDTSEANYLLAVITFLKSATKMFYGQDAERGAPPPLVYLTGLGDYQFNEHPCVISTFQYNLPTDVDYIRAGSPGEIGTNLTTRRDRQTVATNGIFGSLNRLAAAFLTKGAIPNVPAPATLGLNRPTYVPTKIEISLTLLPIQSRSQVSKQFSVKEFANGNLIKGGFW